MRPLDAKHIQKINDKLDLLVHQYVKVDEDREFSDIEEDHQDIVNFVREIEKYIQREKTMEKSQKNL